jgi:hypothetical protein
MPRTAITKPIICKVVGSWETRPFNSATSSRVFTSASPILMTAASIRTVLASSRPTDAFTSRISATIWSTRRMSASMSGSWGAAAANLPKQTQDVPGFALNLSAFHRHLPKARGFGPASCAVWAVIAQDRRAASAFRAARSFAMSSCHQTLPLIAIRFCRRAPHTYFPPFATLHP